MVFREIARDISLVSYFSVVGPSHLSFGAGGDYWPLPKKQYLYDVVLR
jgi:hypothetical protein